MADTLTHRSRALAIILGLLVVLWLPMAAAATTSAPRIVVVGDSLSAEYGLPRGTGWVALLARRMHAVQPEAQVINASISGDTSSGGLARLAPILAQHHPSLVLIELGANDALRGLPLAQTQQNLLHMIKACQAASAQVVLIGMQMPPNYGPAYTQEFAKIYAQVAAQSHAALVPFLLRGIADDPDPQRWFQADGLHPIAGAQATLLNNVWAVLAPLLH